MTAYSTRLTSRIRIQSDVVLDVWVARSKEQAEVLQSMANEDFTLDSGIGVKINIRPVVRSAPSEASVR